MFLTTIRRLTIVLLMLMQTISMSLSSQNIEASIKHYRLEDGLPSRLVYKTIQDHDGFIWIATFGGLVKFDGENFERYIIDSVYHKNIQYREIKTVFCDSHNNIWVGNHGLNLLNRNTKTFESFRNNPNDTNSLGNDLVKDIIEDKNGNIWLGHYNGVSMFDIKKRTFKNYNIPASFVHSLAEDTDGNIWIGSFHQGLYKLNPNKNTIVNYRSNNTEHSIGNNNIKDILLDEKGNIWLATWGGGLNRYNKQSDDFTQYKQYDHKLEYNANNVNALFIDKEDKFWIGTDNGIYLFDRKQYQFKPFYNNNSIDNTKQEKVISSITNDLQGNLWFSGNDGIIYYNQANSNLKFYQNDIIFNPQNRVSKIFNLNNQIYYLNLGTGFFEWDISNNSVHFFKDEKIIHHDKIKRFWKLSDRHLIITLPNQINTIYKKYLIGNNDKSILSNKILNISNDTFGNYWIQYDSILYYSVLNPDKNLVLHETYDKINSLGENKWPANNLIVDNNNNVWSSFWNVLFKYNISTKQIKKFPSLMNGLSSPVFINCVADKLGNVWFATLYGLDKYNYKNDSFVTFNTDNGLPDNNILHIIQDPNDNLWLLTSLGIVSFNPITEELKIFDKNNGLPENIFSTGTLTQNGKISICSERGMLVFDPLSINLNRTIPKIYITRFLINNEIIKINNNSILQNDILYTKEIKLKYNQTNITLEFASLNYINPEKNQYSYCLKQGKNDSCKWIPLGTANRVNFNKLEHGEYIFKIRGSNNDGIWNMEGAELLIKVLPPFYKTYWFLTVMILIIISLIVLAFVGRVRMLQNQKNELEKLVKKRTSELTEQASVLIKLNATKDKLFAIIGHDLKNPFQAIIGLTYQLEETASIEKAKGIVKSIGYTVKNTADILENILNWARTQLRLIIPSNDKIHLHQLITNAIEFFKLNLQKKNISIVTNIPNQICLITDKNMLLTIIRNIIGNAIKYTDFNGSIEINADVNNSTLKLSFTDNGIGMNQQQIEKILSFSEYPSEIGTDGEKGTGLGLLICKDFIEKINGQLFIESELGKGSKFTISLPIENYEDVGTSVQKDPINEIEECITDKDDLLSIEEEKQNAEFLNSIQKEDRVILLIEDNRDIRMSILTQLNKYFKTEYAIDGEKGLEKAFETIPDLIISDVMMPGLDGYELCKLLKSDIRTSHIPVIMLTARTEERSQLTGIISGADDFLTKPFVPNILIARIRNLITQRALLRDKFSKEFILQPSGIPISGSETKFLSTALEIVEKNIDNLNFTVDSFSEQMGLSYMQLYRKMESITGQTPLLFIKSIRLKMALQLIEKTELNITEIALRVGFNDPSHFSKSFKEIFQIPPKQYLLQKRKK